MRLHLIFIFVGILTFGWVLCAQAKRPASSKDGRNVSSGYKQKSNTQNNRGIVHQIGGRKNGTVHHASSTRKNTTSNQIGWRHYNSSTRASPNRTNTNQIGWRYNTTSNSPPRRQNTTHVHHNQSTRNHTQINQNRVNNTRVHTTTPGHIQPTRMPTTNTQQTRRNNTNVQMGRNNSTNSTTPNKGHGATQINHNIPPVYPENHGSVTVTHNIPTVNIPNTNAPPVIIVVNNNPPPKPKTTTTTRRPVITAIPRRKETVVRQRPTKAPSPPPPPYPNTPLAPFRIEVLYLPGGPLGYYTCNAPGPQGQQVPNPGYNNGAWVAPLQPTPLASYNPQLAGNVQLNPQPAFGYPAAYPPSNGQQSYQYTQGQAGQPSSYTNPMYLGNNQLANANNSVGLNQSSTYVNPMYLGNNQMPNSPNPAGLNPYPTYVNPMYLGNNQLQNNSNSPGLSQSSAYVNPMYFGNNQLQYAPNQSGQLGYNGTYNGPNAGVTNFPAAGNVNAFPAPPVVAPQPYITGPQGQLCAFAYFPPGMVGIAPGSLNQPLAGNVAYGMPTTANQPVAAYGGPYQNYPNSAYPNNQPGVTYG